LVLVVQNCLYPYVSAIWKEEAMHRKRKRKRKKKRKRLKLGGGEAYYSSGLGVLK
jgi:hypothetical protein